MDAKDEKMNSPEPILSIEDYRKFFGTIQKERNKRTDAFMENKDHLTWRSLAEVVMAELITFNGKRGGDVAQMKVLDFEKASKNKMEMESAIFKNLSAAEKEAAAIHNLVMVKGKNGKHNYVILTPDIKICMNLLLESRCECEIKGDNIFFFAIAKSDTFLKSSKVLRQFKEISGIREIKTRLIRSLLATSLQAGDSNLTPKQLARLGKQIFL